MGRIGPYELDGLLGRGGMGEVWGAVHPPTGLPVALKVLTADEARRERFLALFRREVRAQASMNHPGVAAVLDLGEVEADTGSFRAGSPYVALERASGGSLDRIAKEGAPYDVVRAHLLALLDALAHCHARGVVHRDLKPANVLLCTSADARPGLKLTDFGIAHLADRTGDADDSVMGTVAYMAPEQVLGRWRDLGPWTDLYALGCLAWKLLAGHAPFVGRPAATVMRAHLEDPPPRLIPRVAVPDGVERWLRRLLAKDPAARFACAADARRDLLGAEDPPVAAGDPLPEPRLRGAGLGLFGLRAVPFVGREAERDRLWAALTEVRREGRPRAVVVTGPSGSGKSRLVRWIAVRAAELGAAAHAEIACDPRDGPVDALQRFVRRATRAQGLEGDALVAHLAPRAGADAAALAEVIAPADPPRVRFDGPRARHAVIARHVARTASPALVLAVDDVQWGADVLDLVELVLETVRAPVLVAITARDEALADAPAVAARLQALEAIPLAPLADREARALLRELLGLETGLEAELAARCGGNPLFAVQLVRGLVEQGSLVATRAGFSLASGAVPALPADLAEVWTSAVGAVLHGLPAAAREWLELAAVLGREVDADEWAAATGADTAALVERLLARRLAIEHEGGFAFVHGMLREAIERSAGARAEAHHARCARVLAERAGSDRARAAAVAERVGRHLLAAGTADAAVEWLLLGADHRLHTSRLEEVLQLLRLAGAALAGASAEDPRWPRLRLSVARVLRNLADLDGAQLEAEAALVWARERRDLEVRDRARYLLGTILRQRSRWEAALAHLSAARDGARARGDLELYALAVEDLGRAHLMRSGPTPEARAHWQEAVHAFERAGDAIGAATSSTYLALHLHREGERARAEATTRAALATFERLGDRHGAAQCHDQLADFARVARDWATCSAENARALAHAEALGQTDIVLTILLHEAAALLEQGRGQDADGVLADALARAGDRRLPLVGMAWLLRAPCAALRGDWPAFDRALDEALGRIGRLANPSAARACEQAAEAADAAGEAARARRVRELALAQWEAFGRTAEAAAVRARLGS